MLNFETIKNFYDKGLWSASLVRMAVKKGILTEVQAEEILSEKED